MKYKIIIIHTVLIGCQYGIDTVLIPYKDKDKDKDKSNIQK